MSDVDNFDLVIIGGGPAGYTAAIRGSQLGLRVACIESRETLGGTCLNVGCIPSKALLHATEVYDAAKHHYAELGLTFERLGFDVGTMQTKKEKVVSTMAKGIEGLFKKNNVTHYRGHGRIESQKTVSVIGSDGKKSILNSKRILIATGSKPIELPNARFDELNIVSSTGALAFREIPQHLVVIGGGVIGLEIGSVWARLGAKLTIIEAQDSILASMDDEVIRQMVKSMKSLGTEIYVKSFFKGVESSKSGLKIQFETSGSIKEINADRLLVAVGRKANTDNLGLEAIGLDLDARGKIVVDAKYQSKVSGVYAIGDVIDGPMLAHKAEEEGVACVEMIAGVAGHVNYDAIPNVVYTWPEVASVGLTEGECKSRGYNYKVGKFPFSANGRAKANNATDGFVKVIADSKTDRLLGVHICGPNASELIAEAVLAFEYKASSEDVARTVHAHPTLSEAIKEACLGIEKRSINI